MASIRGEIHINELPRFQQWLESQGYVAEEPKGVYEVLRVRRGSEVLIWYKRDRSNHLSSSLEDKYIRLTDKYRRYVRQTKENS